MDVDPSNPKKGYICIVSSYSLSLNYAERSCVGQIAEWLNLFGSGGGPENASTPLGLVILLIPSLFLGTSFVVLMLSVHYYAPEDKKIWSHAGLIFAAIYSVLISMNYFVQLTFVVPHLLRGEDESIRPFLFTPFDSFVYSVDLLEYSFMSLSTLFAAFVFTGPGLERTVRWFLIVNGIIQATDCEICRFQRRAPQPLTLPLLSRGRIGGSSYIRENTHPSLVVSFIVHEHVN
jgi:hypothetical protein